MNEALIVIDVSDDINDYHYYLHLNGKNTVTAFSFPTISKRAMEICNTLDKLGIMCTIFYSEKASHRIYMEGSNATLLGVKENDD